MLARYEAKAVAMKRSMRHSVPEAVRNHDFFLLTFECKPALIGEFSTAQMAW